jgi:hypothetical protein
MDNLILLDQGIHLLSLGPPPMQTNSNSLCASLSVVCGFSEKAELKMTHEEEMVARDSTIVSLQSKNVHTLKVSEMTYT